MEFKKGNDIIHVQPSYRTKLNPSQTLMLNFPDSCKKAAMSGCKTKSKVGWYCLPFTSLLPFLSLGLVPIWMRTCHQWVFKVKRGHWRLEGRCGWKINLTDIKSITYSTFEHNKWQEKFQSNLQDTFLKQHTMLLCLESLQCFFLSIQGFLGMQMHSQPTMWKVSVITHYQSNDCYNDTRLQLML